MRPADIVAGLRRNATFARLDDEALAQLARVAVPRSWRHDQFLWYQGDPGDHLVVLTAGLVKITVTSERGDEMVLTTVGPPGLVGELSVIDEGRRSASVVAVEPTTALVIARAPLIGLMAQSPALLDALLRTLGALVRRLTEQTTDLVFLDLGGRVAKLLVQQADQQLSGGSADGVTVDLPLTQTELAQLLGASRPAVNRVLQGLASRGVISIDRRTIVLHDAATLRRRAGLA